MNLLRQAVLILFCFIAGFVHAQQLITSYSVDQGLPQSTVTSLYRDNEGYLWCGTGSGLGLYDGWEFHTPKQSAEKPNPTLNSIVRGIVPSSDQKTIWAGSESTINQFDRFSYHLIRSFDVVKRPGVTESPIVANDTAVWVAVGSEGLYRVRINDGKTVQLTRSGYEGGRPIVSANGRKIFLTDTTDHLVVYDILSNEMQSVLLPGGLSGDNIFCLRTNPQDPSRIILLTSKGLWEYDQEKNVFQRFLLGDKHYTDTLMDFRAMDVHPDGSWWFGVTNAGVFRYDPSTHQLRSCAWQQDGSFTGKLLVAPTCIVCDAYGVVWCGTDGDGVVKLLHTRVLFNDRFKHSLITDTCNWFTRCFYEMNAEQFLVGTFRGGLQLIDYRNNKIQHVTAGPLWDNITPLFITESGDGRLVVGTDKSLLLIDTTDWSTTQVTVDYPITDTKFTGYLRDASGELIIYGNTGYGRLQLSPTARWIRNTSAPGYYVVTSGVLLNDGRIILSTFYNGLYELNAEAQFVKAYDYEKFIGIPTSATVRGMIERGNKLYLGTESGVCVLNSTYKLDKILTTDSGISDNTIYGIEALDGETIVISTGHGITLLNTTTSDTRVYNGLDGLPSDECNSGALLAGKSGWLYIGTPDGFVRWNPASSQTCFREPKILVSYAEPGNSGMVNESIVRNYGSGSIDLNIWLTDFAFPQRSVFHKQLEGVEAGITDAIGLRKISYAALGSGFYSLLCSADIPGCNPTAMAKLLTIKIVPPFWMSAWFIGISSMGVIVIITLILFIVMRLNYQRKIRKLKMQQELDKVRQRISRDIHDEIGAGLTRIALSGELMSRKPGVSSDKLKAIATTARELSQSMKEVVWSVNPHYDSLDHMIAYFRSYVAGVAENADVRFVYSADDFFPAEPVNPETRRNLLLILKEAISNSAKYSGCNELKLEIRWRDGKFRMIISDNGKGFNMESAAGINSNGLRNMRQRAEASACTVEINSSDAGTNIVVEGRIDTR